MTDEPEIFAAGTRVQTRGAWEWPDGTVGTIKPFPDGIRELHNEHPDSTDVFFAAGLGCHQKTRLGWEVIQYVEFDEPTDDGSGDGPYLGGCIEMECLVPLDD